MSLNNVDIQIFAVEREQMIIYLHNSYKAYRINKFNCFNFVILILTSLRIF